MSNAIRWAVAALIGTGTFFGAALGIEMLSWWWFAPADPLAEPAANALRFAASATAALGAGLAVGRSGRMRASAVTMVAR